MLRRYLITNAVCTAVLYAAMWAAWPIAVAQVNKLTSLVLSSTTENPLIGPLIQRLTMLIGA